MARAGFDINSIKMQVFIKGMPRFRFRLWLFRRGLAILSFITGFEVHNAKPNGENSVIRELRNRGIY